MQHLGLKYYHAKSLKEICLGFRFWNSFRGDNPPYTLSICHSATHSDNILKPFRCCNIRDTTEVGRAVAGPKQFQAIISYGSPSWKNNYSVKSGSSLECLITSCVKNKQAKKLKKKTKQTKNKENIQQFFFCTHPPNFTSSVPTCLTNVVHCRCTVLYM